MICLEDIIADILTCPKCKQKFDDPRILPCGETLCHRCILLNFDAINNGINCDYCMFFHKLSLTFIAFPPNKRIEKLLEQEEIKIIESNLFNQFKQLLSDLKQASEDLKTNKNNSVLNVKEYCDSLRHDMQLTTDNLIAEIQKQKEKLLGEIQIYENECLKHIEKVTPCLNFELNSVLLDSHKFQNKWNEYLSFQVVKESDLSNARESGSELLRRLNKEKNVLKQFQLNENIAIFRASKVDLNLIGIIHYENLAHSLIIMEKFCKIDLKYKLNAIDITYFDSFYVQCFEDGDFLFSFPSSPFNIKLILFRYGSVLKDYEIVQPTSKFKQTIHKNKIFLFCSYSQKLRLLDKNFSTLDEINVGEEILSLTATDDLLYCLTDKNIVLKYDHSLKLTQRIKVNQETLDGIIVPETKLSNLKAHKDFLYLSNPNGIIAINLRNLKEFKKIKINEKQFIFYGEKIVSLNNGNLIFYDLNGQFVQKQELSKSFTKKLILVESENTDKLSIFDFSTYILYNYDFLE